MKPNKYFNVNVVGWLVKRASCGGAIAVALLMPAALIADPIELKLSFFGSEHAPAYLLGVKPFVDAINTDGQGLVTIKVYFNGALGNQAQQPQLVLDGDADIAFVVPGVTPYRFPDNVLLEQPSLFKDAREGTLVYTHMVAAKALGGFEKYIVLGAYTPDPNIIHSRKPIDSLADLKGQKIRVNNPVEGDTLARLGAIPTVLQIPKIREAIGAGTVDGVTLSPTGMVEFGVAPVASHHYLLRVGTAPLALLMSREKFDSLPDKAKGLIRKYSGNWMADKWAKAYEIAEQQALNQLNSDPQQDVVTPSPSDLKTAQRIYRSVTDAWAAKSERNRRLLQLIETELAAIRSAE